MKHKIKAKFTVLYFLYICRKKTTKTHIHTHKNNYTIMIKYFFDDKSTTMVIVLRQVRGSNDVYKKANI